MEHNLKHTTKYSYATGKPEEEMIPVTDISMQNRLNKAFAENEFYDKHDLSDVYMSDFVALGYTIVLKSPAIFITPFFESYYAFLIRNDEIISCELTYYLNGNGKIKSISGENVEEIFALLEERREKTKILRMFRIFFRYLFFMLGMPTGTAMLIFIFQKNLFGVLLAFLLITFLYIVETITQNAC